MKFYMLDLNILHCIHYEIATIAVMKCALLIELLCMQNVHREQQTDIVLNVLIILRMFSWWIKHSKVLMSLQKLVKSTIYGTYANYLLIVYKIYILWWLDIIKMIMKKFKNNLFLFIKDVSDEWETWMEAKVETGAQVHITKLLTVPTLMI